VYILLTLLSLRSVEYGRFLRTTEPYSSLLDFKTASLVGDLEPIGDDPSSVRQSVCLKLYEGSKGDVFFDFIFSRSAVNQFWYLDVVLHRPAV
jgi:hypothetical protein